MKFNHLNVPTHWRNYWSRYPEGHTILEALISWVSQVDSMVDNQNKLNDNVAQFRNEIDEFVGKFDERLQDEVTHTLEDWQTSGFLDVVISAALQWQLDDYITTNEQDKNSLNAQLQQRPTQQEVNLLLGNITEGTPLFTSSLDGMTDITRVYVNTVDGLLYVHNGTSFVSTGVAYQSTGLSDGVVTTEKTNFFKQPVNLFNPNDNDFKDSTYIASITADNIMTADNPTYFTSGYIDVSKLSTISISSFHGLVTCKADKKPIERLSVYQEQVDVSNAHYIRFAANKNTLPTLMVNGGVELLPYEPYHVPYLTNNYLSSELLNRINALEDGFSREISAGGYKYAFNLANNTFESTELFDEMGDYTIAFRGEITTFTRLDVGKGKGLVYGAYAQITPDSINIYYANTLQKTYAHGLTLKDYISVRITTEKHTIRATLYVDTNGGSYELPSSSLIWDGRQGKLFATADTSTNLQNCTLSYFCNGWNNDIWLFGDSYFNLGSNSRWTAYLNARSQNTNILLNAFPGRASVGAYNALLSCLNVAKPKKIIWCLGMNDGDSGTTNANWLTTVTNLINICTDKNIELILTTIPNVPTVDNTYKNNYVKNSGYRYIDFAKAVGAVDDTTWFATMLSSDGVHPDTQGALALYTQAITDVPELNS